jgi:hypothetical protein
VYDGGRHRSSTLVTDLEITRRKCPNGRTQALTGVWSRGEGAGGRRRKGTTENGQKTTKITSKKANTHGDPGRHEVDLVQHIDQLLVALFFPQEIHHRSAPRTQGVPRIQHVDHDVTRIEDLVEFSPDTAGSTLGIDGLAD